MKNTIFLFVTVCAVAGFYFLVDGKSEELTENLGDLEKRLPIDDASPEFKNCYGENVGSGCRIVNDELAQEVSDQDYEEAIARQSFKSIVSQKQDSGFVGAGILIGDEEIAEYEGWSEELGQFFERLDESDYATYDTKTLYALAKSGDLRAYEVLRSNRLDKDQLHEVLRVGVVSGSNSAIYEAANRIHAEAKSIFDKGDAERYKQLFTDQLALLELYEMRGGFLSDRQRERLLSSYRLDDIDDIRKTAKDRTPELIKEINRKRSSLALEPLNLDVPDVVIRVNAMQACGGNKQCLAEYLPPDFL